MTTSGSAKPSDFHAGLLLQRVDIRRQQEGLKVSIRERERLLSSREEQLSTLAAKEPTYAKLQQAIDMASESTARLLRARADQQTLDAIDSDERMGNLSVTQNATLPANKEGPDRFKSLVAGLFGGLFLGLALAVARQLLDSRLRDPKHLERTLGLRVLGVVPEDRGWRRNGERLRRAMVK